MTNAPMSPRWSLQGASESESEVEAQADTRRQHNSQPASPQTMQPGTVGTHDTTVEHVYREHTATTATTGGTNLASLNVSQLGAVSHVANGDLLPNVQCNQWRG
jgi:hypothetical protein